MTELRQTILIWMLSTGIGWANVTPHQEAINTSRRGERESAPTADEVVEARTRLAELGYWLDPYLDGRHPSFRHALIAFQKTEGRPLTGKLTTAELEAIRQASVPLPAEEGETHLEIDLFRQTLFLVEPANRTVRILPVSSGSGECFTEGGRTRRALTPTGRFAVTRKISGWRRSSLGKLYYPLYFHLGVAIHGSNSVPIRPASHGCIRIPIYAAAELAEIVSAGTPILIYDSNPSPAARSGPCPASTELSSGQ